jgi:hypothetical protein
MNGEAGILQDGIEVAPLERRIRDAQERIRSDQNEENECDRDRGLHREHGGLEPRRQVAAEQPDQRAEQAENEHP